MGRDSIGFVLSCPWMRDGVYGLALLDLLDLKDLKGLVDSMDFGGLAVVAEI